MSSPVITSRPQPVFSPETNFEKDGGVEDPRLVRIGGTYYLTYTGYNKKDAQLCLATSKDLIHWDRKGVIIVDKSAALEDDVMTAALDGGADDVRAEESELEIVTDPSAFGDVKAALEKAGIPILSAEITMVPQNTVPVDGSDARAVLKLMEALEDHDDVQNVYANFDIPEAVLAEVG